MSNGATGFWAAAGALLDGIAGAQAGKYAAHVRPRFQYDADEAPLARRPGGGEVEDAMVIGGAVGAVIGAFVGGTVAGEPQVAPQVTVVPTPAPAKPGVAGVYFP